MKKTGLALAVIGLSLWMGASTAYAGGWHGNCGSHSGWYGRPYYGHYSNDAAIVAATLFGTAALVGAVTGPRYVAPPPAYYPPPPPAYYPPPPPVIYYPAPVPYYAPRGYYVRPY